MAVATVYTSVGGKPAVLAEIINAGARDPEIEQSLQRVRQAPDGPSTVGEIVAGKWREVDRFTKGSLRAVFVHSRPPSALSSPILSECHSDHQYNVLLKKGPADRVTQPALRPVPAPPAVIDQALP